MIFTETERNLARDLFGRIRIETAVTGGGVTRPSYGVQETRAMQLVAETADQLKLFTSIDDCANLVMTIEPQRPKRATWMGSHLDSVPNGGNYDGLAGVIAAMLVLNKAKNRGDTKPLVGVGLRGEESAWFGTPHIGAKALLGKLPADDLRRRCQPANLMLGHAMQDCGVKTEILDMIEKGTPIVPIDNIEAWWELHIEQGPVLKAMDTPIGAVSHVRGSMRALSARMTGKTGHSGTTPHEMREDAVVRFADFITACEERRLGLADYGKDIVMTCGIAHTNKAREGITSIADEVTFALDVRSTDLVVMRDLYEFAAMYGGDHLELGELVTTLPCTLEPSFLGKTTLAAMALGIKNVAMPSGAGHDATVFQTAGIPSGMIFVRNDHGSHNPYEEMGIDDFMLGVETLYRVVTA